jgi:hypothetical protein
VIYIRGPWAKYWTVAGAGTLMRAIEGKENGWKLTSVAVYPDCGQRFRGGIISPLSRRGLENEVRYWSLYVPRQTRRSVDGHWRQRRYCQQGKGGNRGRLQLNISMNYPREVKMRSYFRKWALYTGTCKNVNRSDRYQPVSTTY